MRRAITQIVGLGISLSVATMLGACVKPGQFVDVDPIYNPVQQVHQSFYRAQGFDPTGKRVAILDFKGDRGVGQVFADVLAIQLFQQNLDVVERENVKVLLQEMRMAESGAQKLSDNEILQKIGQMAGVDVVIVGGVVTYQESVAKLEFEEPVTLPFHIISGAAESVGGVEALPPPGWTIYRWKPGSYRTPAGVPVNANIYASARAIDVKTGKIIWIDTVNVQTSGITEVTGLERLGQTMASNFAGSNNDHLQMFVPDGSRFEYPDNWETVKGAYLRFLRQQRAMGGG